MDNGVSNRDLGSTLSKLSAKSNHSGNPTVSPGYVQAPDLYCLVCGYNLRGLPKLKCLRCPECGKENELEQLLIPADLISMQLRRLETAPSCSLGLLLTLAVMMGVMLSLFETPVGLSFPKGDERRKLMVAAAMSAAVILAFFWVLGLYRRSCEQRPGWLSALLMYYLYAVLMVAGSLTLVSACVSVSRGLIQPANTTLQYLATVLSQGVLVISIPLWIWWTNGRAKRSMVSLQRSVAVAMAAKIMKSRQSE